MAGLGLRPVSETSDRPGLADWAVLDAIEALDRLRPGVGCAWNFGWLG